MLYRADNADRTVVFCNPIFEERKSAQRAMVEAANLFCNSGFNVVTFDYRGCGDSGGYAHSYDVNHWVADIHTAAQFAADATGCKQIGLLGLRCGASFAIMAMNNSPSAFSFAALWAPVITGRTYVDQELRKKLTKEMVIFGKNNVK
ncbi:MAG: alpha/beta hydrolase, partial [Lentisphaerae bacterium]|nr:alpha/beta hydrolase [Lentisphaerota bacterium]